MVNSVCKNIEFMALGENAQLTKLQNGGSVESWRDKQEIVTGICGTKMALTVYALFMFLIQLHNHRS